LPPFPPNARRLPVKQQSDKRERVQNAGISNNAYFRQLRNPVLSAQSRHLFKKVQEKRQSVFSTRGIRELVDGGKNFLSGTARILLEERISAERSW
jgi:hypothetical protein